MIVREAVQLAPNWSPEMMGWAVIGIRSVPKKDIRTVVMDDGSTVEQTVREYIQVQIGAMGPWNPGGAEEVVLEFPMDHYPNLLFKPIGDKFATIADMDPCPPGAILVWSEHEVD